MYDCTMHGADQNQQRLSLHHKPSTAETSRTALGGQRNTSLSHSVRPETSFCLSSLTALSDRYCSPTWIGSKTRFRTVSSLQVTAISPSRNMPILHVALARLDESRLKVSREEAYRDIHRMLLAIPVPMTDIRVGPPINPAGAKGYDIILSMKFENYTGFEAYLAHPKHIELVKCYGSALRDVIIYQVDGRDVDGRDFKSKL
ncbi:hypothetical protein BC628DRAFT_259959 [Trametes gibbosa]|nr:hypothetical protein BC628DRAFT_259959 [Trametes gibbosa]